MPCSAMTCWASSGSARCPPTACSSRSTAAGRSACAARLCRSGYRSLEDVADADEEALQQVEDIGPKVAASLRAHLNRDGARAELARLRELGVHLDVRYEDLPPQVAADAPLAGKTFVITGTIADPRSGEKVARPAFQRLCERAG